MSDFTNKVGIVTGGAQGIGKGIARRLLADGMTVVVVSLGPAIRVNGICPGWIEVRDWQKASRRQQPQHSESDRLQHPSGRVGTPDDIAALTAFLLSDEAGFITGHCFPVDGGMTIRMIYEE